MLVCDVDREAFWAEQAGGIEWFREWEKVLEWKCPNAKWFVGGKLNAAYNCLDRHGDGKKVALIWEGERGEERQICYEELEREVGRFSNALRSLGVKKGDKVAIYLPMVPEAVVAMLSCARVGAVHTVVFAGFSAGALRDRVVDAGAKVLVTADGGWRKGKVVRLKETADEAVEGVECVESVVVVKRSGERVAMREGRDFWYDELVGAEEDVCRAEAMDAEDELFILYTSGTTGKPKGIVHTTGGYMVGVHGSMKRVFDLGPSDVYWCTADVGWITGHSYVVYGPLSCGATVVMYEGAPDFPERDRFWRVIEKYGVTVFYTAPTAIRTFMKWGEEWLEGCDLSSLRLLGSVGEPINPEAWMWYQRYVGRGVCPVVDTWWQTETGSIMIAPVAGAGVLKPGSVMKPLPGVEAEVVGGQLVLTQPWPSMMRGIHGDPGRYGIYWKDGMYFTGDGAKVDEDGDFWLCGRVDDVINVSGHRLGTAEIESALIEHKSVAESAVVAISHGIKGQAIVAFVALKEGMVATEEELKLQVCKTIGALARPERIVFIHDLPKTRSGKIMRRLLGDIAEGRVVGDQTTLSDPSVIREIKEKYEED